jgi:hypothetical protein
MGLTIDRVRTRAELSEFITLPRLLYKDFPDYVAPLDHERRQLLDPRKSAFFTHGVACYWIARRDGTAVGRVSAQIDFAAVGPDAREIGMFGCLDTIDDGEVVAALLRAAEDWLRERKRRTIRGPFLLSIAGEPGLLIEGQWQSPTTLLGWHPAYLAGHVREAGYATATRLYCFNCKQEELKEESDTQRQAAAAMLARANVVIRDMRLDNLAADMEIARRIVNDGWRRNWGYTPVTESDVRALASQFKPFLSTDSGFFIETRGEPAAIMLAIPNLFDIMTDIGPAPGPFGWAKLMFRIWRQRYRSYRVVLVGLISKYQNSVLGSVITGVTFAEEGRRLRARGADVVLGWVQEDNHALLKAFDALGFRSSRTYSVYEKHLII